MYKLEVKKLSGKYEITFITNSKNTVFERIKDVLKEDAGYLIAKYNDSMLVIENFFKSNTMQIEFNFGGSARYKITKN